MEQSKATAKCFRKCKICDKNLHKFYLLREYKRKEHGVQRGSRAKIVDVTQLMGDVDDSSLK